MFVGIDVAKAELAASIVPSVERFTVSNDVRGVRSLVERLGTVKPALIVLEATGGYELLGVAALAAACEEEPQGAHQSSRARLRITDTDFGAMIQQA